MVVPRKWKIVAGTMSATVALGAGGALADEGSGDAGVGDQPALVDVVKADDMPSIGDLGPEVVLPQVLDQDVADSPFDSVAEESLPSEPSEESLASMPSEESLASEPSEESLPSVPSEESTESISVPSEPSPESID